MSQLSDADSSSDAPADAIDLERVREVADDDAVRDGISLFKDNCVADLESDGAGEL